MDVEASKDDMGVGRAFVPAVSADAVRDWEKIARQEYLSAIEWAGRHQHAMLILSDLDAAVFLAAEFTPNMTIGDFFKASGAVSRSRAFLFEQQYLEYPAQGTSAGTAKTEGLGATPAGPVACDAPSTPQWED